MHDVIRINRLMARHGDLLSRIWEGEVTSVDESNARAVNDLKAVHVLIGDDDGNIRLSRTYRELLERSIGRRGHYGASRSIGMDLRRLSAVAVDAQHSCQIDEGAVLHQKAIEEGCDIIWELSDTLETTIRDYERILHDGMGGNGDIKARARRTQFHIDRLDELRQAVVFLTDDPVHEALLHFSCRDLRREYSRLVESKMNQAVNRIVRVSKEMTRLLLHDRDILAETRRARMALELFKKMPDETATELMTISKAFPTMPQFTFAPLVDPCDTELGAVREELARKAEPRPRRPVQKVETVEGLIEVDLEAIEETHDPAAELSLAFEMSLTEENATSLRSWLEAHGGDVEADHAFETIMTSILSEQKRFSVEFIPPLHEVMSSRISDIMVRPLSWE